MILMCEMCYTKSGNDLHTIKHAGELIKSTAVTESGVELYGFTIRLPKGNLQLCMCKDCKNAQIMTENVIKNAQKKPTKTSRIYKLFNDILKSGEK